MKFTTYELVFRGISYVATDAGIFSRFSRAYDEAVLAGKDPDAVLDTIVRELLATRSLQLVSTEE